VLPVTSTIDADNTSGVPKLILLIPGLVTPNIASSLNPGVPTSVETDGPAPRGITVGRATVGCVVQITTLDPVKSILPSILNPKSPPVAVKLFPVTASVNPSAEILGD